MWAIKTELLYRHIRSHCSSTVIQNLTFPLKLLAVINTALRMAGASLKKPDRKLDCGMHFMYINTHARTHARHTHTHTPHTHTHTHTHTHRERLKHTHTHTPVVWSQVLLNLPWMTSKLWSTAFAHRQTFTVLRTPICLALIFRENLHNYVHEAFILVMNLIIWLWSTN